MILARGVRFIRRISSSVSGGLSGSLTAAACFSASVMASRRLQSCSDRASVFLVALLMVSAPRAPAVSQDPVRRVMCMLRRWSTCGRALSLLDTVALRPFRAQSSDQRCWEQRAFESFACPTWPAGYFSAVHCGLYLMAFPLLIGFAQPHARRAAHAPALSGLVGAIYRCGSGGTTFVACEAVPSTHAGTVLVKCRYRQRNSLAYAAHSRTLSSESLLRHHGMQ